MRASSSSSAKRGMVMFVVVGGVCVGVEGRGEGCAEVRVAMLARRRLVMLRYSIVGCLFT